MLSSNEMLLLLDFQLPAGDLKDCLPILKTVILLWFGEDEIYPHFRFACNWSSIVVSVSASQEWFPDFVVQITLGEWGT